MRIDSPLMTNAVITGSFSGSFSGVGNFTGLEADSVEFANVLNKPTLISGSAQIASDISGSFTSLSASIASDIAGLGGEYATDAELNASSSALISAYQGADTSLSSSLAADIASNLAELGAIGSFTASLDADLTTLSVPANTTISSFGASLVDDADASAARTTLGVDAAGTDNSTDVTLVTTSHDYLSIAGQAITLGTVDISDDTNLTAGTGVTLTGDTLSIGQAVGTGDSVTFASLTTTGNVTIQGDLSVLGDAVEIQVGSLSIEDKNILVASGAADSAAADGAGITIGGANESLTWNHANSRFNLSDDLNVEGNITLTGTVDGRDLATDGSKLDGIEAGADVTDTTNVTAAGALMDSEVTSLSGIKTLTVPDSTTISAFGKTLVDDADAAAARTTLGVDAAGTDNSTDVTLAGSYDYITIAGQVITRGQVDASTDISNLTTSNVSEVTNLYYTDTRVKTKLSAEAVVSGSASQVRTFLNVEDGATADQTAGEIKTAYESNADTNAFTDALLSKLNAIESNADVTDTANVTAAGALMDSEVDADIKTLSLPANTTISAFGKTLVDDADAAAARTTLGLGTAATTNSTAYATAAQGTTADAALPKAGGQMTGNITFSGAQTVDGRDLSVDGSKLDGIEAGADVTDATNVTAAGALMDSELTSLSGVKTLTVPDNTTISAFGKTLVDDADAAAARTTLGVDAAGTDNSTDVTLAGTRDYITISGQIITRNQIDISDDTNLAVSDTTGQTGINLTLSGDTISGVVSGLTTTSNVTFASLTTTGNVTIQGDLSVLGDAVEIQVGSLSIEDKNILIASGAADSAAADGAGITIGGANETITWNHASSRFDFSDDVNVTGNITLSGTVDGRDIATDGSKLDGIAASANNYTHPSYTARSIDTSGAEVLDTFTSDTSGHVTAITKRTMTLADLGYTGATNANNYSHPSYTARSIDTSGASVLDVFTSDTSGHVTNITTRTLTLADLGYTGATNADNYSSWTIRDGDTTTYTITSGDTLQIASGTGITSNFTADDVLTITNSGVTSIVAGSGISISGGTGAVTVTNTITNNNQLTNGAGYTTYTANQTLNNNSNVHFEGLMVGQTTGATANTIRCVGDVVAYYSSDAQFKDNVETLEGALDKVKAIRGVRFDWNDKQDVHTGHDIGVIAQEVEAVLPELVHHREHNDSKAVDYVKLTAVLIEAVKELAAKVEELEKK